MNWFKESVNLFFSITKKELISLFFGILILLVGFRLKAPQLKIGYAISILTLLTMTCRYNFVADYIITSDFKNLKKYKNIFPYIIGKNIFSFLLCFILVFIVFIINFLITKTSYDLAYYSTLLKCGICVLAMNNIIFAFHNKPSKLRCNDFSVIKNIKLGFSDLIESLPSLLIVFLIYFSNIYFYKITIYSSITTLIFSIIILNLKIKETLRS